MYDAAKQAGVVLRHLIDKHYESQAEFAEDFGVEVRTVSRYVNNGINKIDLLQEMADFFKVDLIYFFQGE